LVERYATFPIRDMMIVFLLRHADRTSADDLSEAGERRAKLLARMLADTGISVASRSHFIRAAKTLHPLEMRLPGSLQVKQINEAAATLGSSQPMRMEA
jgi:phosphohistidine phosphatase SixA